MFGMRITITCKAHKWQSSVQTEKKNNRNEKELKKNKRIENITQIIMNFSIPLHLLNDEKCLNNLKN